ncbi:hypothetical protein L2E82_15560 [Cichorium intybus]|uniref:Uncharacterized protein n=1 Tax=Cichorium intybus TaxID=13427 RepID=A0ACB9F2R2_CICIN|nr:hypothetical protein L2E82_15560 [Cichorium intybus]
MEKWPILVFLYKSPSKPYEAYHRRSTLYITSLQISYISTISTVVHFISSEFVVFVYGSRTKICKDEDNHQWMLLGQWTRLDNFRLAVIPNLTTSPSTELHLVLTLKSSI